MKKSTLLLMVICVACGEPDFEDVEVGSQQQVITTLASRSGPLYDMDAVGSWLYWCEGAGIYRMPKSGGSVSTICNPCVSNDYVDEIAVDGTWVYYRVENTIDRIRISDGQRAPWAFNDPYWRYGGAPHNLTVDQDYVYWVGDFERWNSAGQLEPYRSLILRLPKYAQSGTPTTLVDTAPVHDMTPSASRLYYTTDYTVSWVAKSGSSSGRIYQLTGTIDWLLANNPKIDKLALGTTYVYWSEKDSRIRRAPRAGGAPTSYSTTVSNARVKSLSVDPNEAYIYYTEQSGTYDRVRGISTTGGTPSTLAQYLYTLTRDISADLYTLYWFDRYGIYSNASLYPRDYSVLF
jgi:hypothetical protein